MNRKNFCAAPWSGLSISPNGSAKICCISENKIEFNSLQDVKESSVFIEVRDAVIKDQQHENCNVCWKQEKNNIYWDSRRSIYQPDDFYHDLNSKHSFQLEHLDLRWSNTCNLNCVYCNPTFSSRWANLLNIKQKFRINPVFDDNDLRHLKYLQMAGGEPFLIKENLDLLEKTLKLNPEIQIEVTTNLTSIQNNAIYDLLKKCKNVTIVISFESIEDKFEYIRNGADWKKFVQNFKICSRDFSNVQVNMVYFPLSAVDIKSAIQFALTYLPEKSIFIREQENGHGFDMLSKNSLKYINDKNLNFANSLNDVLKYRLTKMVNQGKTDRDQTHLPNYQKFDHLVAMNHKMIFPELYL